MIIGDLSSITCKHQQWNRPQNCIIYRYCTFVSAEYFLLLQEESKQKVQDLEADKSELEGKISSMQDMIGVSMMVPALVYWYVLLICDKDKTS